MADNCNEPNTHLFVLSFTVGGESGLALVAANSATQAFQVLKNSGSRHCDGYTLQQSRDIGMTCQCHYGLLMESFVNAIAAYDAIVSVANMIKGDKGDKGDDGTTTNIADTFDDTSSDHALSARLGGILKTDVDNSVRIGPLVEANVVIQ